MIDIDALIDNFSNSIEIPENEYVGEDGLLRCSVCDHKTEKVIVHPFTGDHRKVRCKCGCKSIKELFDEKMAAEELERKRMICFVESNMASWNFANDDRRNEKLSDAMKSYADNFAEMKRIGRGLLLHGTCGTGKTYYAACIANALIDNGYSVLMTSISKITNQLQGMFEGKQEYINSLNRYGLLIIDDLGVERDTAYMVEQVYNIIESRYRSGLPMIITTNLTADELKKPKDIEHARIYDRVLERCHPIEVSGASRRRQSVRETYQEMNRMLGL